MHKDELNLHKEAEKIQKAEIKKLPKKEKYVLWTFAPFIPLLLFPFAFPSFALSYFFYRTVVSKQHKQQCADHVKNLQQRQDQRLLRFNLLLKEQTKYGENSGKWTSLWELDQVPSVLLPPSPLLTRIHVLLFFLLLLQLFLTLFPGHPSKSQREARGWTRIHGSHVQARPP